jgi:hypothetical protein
MILSTHGIVGSISGAVPLLLDIYPSAAVAYSVRKLRTLYTGSAIRVRRSSDNTEQDIGFSGGNLDTSALTSFCSGTNGFVTTWYDQSGNGLNATQTTALAQPKIVNAGSILLQNSKPIMKADNNFSCLVISRSIPKVSFTSVFYTLSLDTTDNFFVALADAGGWYFMVSNSGSSSTAVNANIGTVTVYRNSSVYTVTTRGNVYTDFQGQKLLTVIGGSTNTIGNPDINIGYRDSGPIKMSNSQELIIYNSNQTTNISGIQSEINTYYGIY